MRTTLLTVGGTVSVSEQRRLHGGEFTAKWPPGGVAIRILVYRVRLRQRSSFEPAAVAEGSDEAITAD